MRRPGSSQAPAVRSGGSRRPPALGLPRPSAGRSLPSYLLLAALILWPVAIILWTHNTVFTPSQGPGGLHHSHRNFGSIPIRRPRFPSSKTSSSAQDSTECHCGVVVQQLAHPSCCQRFLFRVHKMGQILVDKLFHPYRDRLHLVHLPDHTPVDFLAPPVDRGTSTTGNHLNSTSSSSLIAAHNMTTNNSPYYPDHQAMNKRKDYRYVVVVRRWTEALVSGYLYHRAGYECWLSAEGSTRVASHLNRIRYVGWLQQHYDWPQQLSPDILYYYRQSLSHMNGTRTSPNDPPPPADLVGRRNLCQYLQDVPEEQGLLIYIDFALNRWYKNLLWTRQLADQATGPSPGATARIRFVCYEPLAHPDTQRKTAREMMDWLFPGGGHPATFSRRETHVGGHSANTDPVRRERLIRLVRDLDSQFFNDTVSTAERIFGC